LLVTFHNETWGEKFFQLLARLSQNPREHILLLEMINYCLLLGFEGRYRVLDNGRTQLETIKQRLWQMIRGVRGSYPPPLSPHPEDRPVLRKLWRPMVPLWACVALVGLLPVCSISFLTGVLATTPIRCWRRFTSPSCRKPHSATGTAIARCAEPARLPET
jgi:type IV/VI secretion system ImpK/VasF family protein